MTVRFFLLITLLCFSAAWTSNPFAEVVPFVNGDPLPDAPELARRGEHKVGVRTLKLVNPNQIDILNYKEGEAPLYDRPLTVEVWYPAMLAEGQKEYTEYDEVLGNANSPDRPLIPFTFPGRAARDAEPKRSEGAFPLVIVSHGYTGSRYLMTYLTENLASKGYVVVAIDHTESTFRDAAAFQSTLLNRPLDILFVLDEMARLSKKGNNSFLAGLADADQTALVGYSMGGYGVLNASGAGYSQQLVGFFSQRTNGSTAVSIHAAGSPEMAKRPDPRIKAVVALAPWGMNFGLWNAEGLQGLKTPTLFVSGSQDDISGYEKGVKALYDGAVKADRYLLTYRDARHNVAPNPPPAAALAPGLHIDEYLRYADSVWDQRRINNVNQHFITAFLGKLLKNQDYDTYLDLPVNANDGSWAGFKPRTAVGLEFRKSSAE